MRTTNRLSDWQSKKLFILYKIIYFYIVRLLEHNKCVKTYLIRLSLLIFYFYLLIPFLQHIGKPDLLVWNAFLNFSLFRILLCAMMLNHVSRFSYYNLQIDQIHTVVDQFLRMQPMPSRCEICEHLLFLQLTLGLMYFTLHPFLLQPNILAKSWLFPASVIKLDQGLHQLP